MPIVEMEVHMDCGGCERKIRKALSGLEGVETVDIDLQMQKVTVTGYADETQVLNTVKSTGKKATLWSYAYNAEYRPYAAHYHNYHNQHHTTPASTYSYQTHGSNGNVQGCYQSPPSSSAMVDGAAAFFSDENPHACSLM